MVEKRDVKRGVSQAEAKREGGRIAVSVELALTPPGVVDDAWRVGVEEGKVFRTNGNGNGQPSRGFGDADENIRERSTAFHSRIPTEEDRRHLVAPLLHEDGASADQHHCGPRIRGGHRRDECFVLAVQRERLAVAAATELAEQFPGLDGDLAKHISHGAQGEGKTEELRTGAAFCKDAFALILGAQPRDHDNDVRIGCGSNAGRQISSVAMDDVDRGQRLP